MLDQILKQPFWASISFLTFWVGYTGTVGNDGLCVGCDPDKLCLRHTEEGWMGGGGGSGKRGVGKGR